jgi:SNF2 family DNA or RNA helicase
MIERKRVILAHDLGLGKTRSALIAAKAYELPIIVICPASLVINWQRGQ